MKMNFGVTGILTAFVVLLASSVAGQIHVLNSNQVARVFNELNEVDFETLPVGAAQLPNPLRLNGVIFTDPATLRAGFCSSPTCEPDPDNAIGGNMALILNPQATISFARASRIVVLDLQGNGTHRISFRVTDARGHTKTVVAQSAAFATTVVGLSSRAGIRRVEVLRVDPSPRAGPMSLARVLFSDPKPRYRPVPNGPPRWPTRRG